MVPMVGRATRTTWSQERATRLHSTSQLAATSRIIFVSFFRKFTTIGVAVSAAVFFCFFNLPTSTTGELLGVAVAFAGEAFADDPNNHQPFSLVGCFFAGDAVA